MGYRPRYKTHAGWIDGELFDDIDAAIMSCAYRHRPADVWEIVHEPSKTSVAHSVYNADYKISERDVDWYEHGL